MDIERIVDPTEEDFRKNFVEKGRPVVVISKKDRPAQFNWDFDHMCSAAGNQTVPVYDWGENGPTTDDHFVIRQMKLGDFISVAREVTSPETQRYSICQLSIKHIPELAKEYQIPSFLANSERLDRLPWLFSETHRRALFVSFFRGIHWHNGREAVAQLLAGRKKFVLYSPKDSRYLYPRRFLRSPKAWFDETEAVFCSEIPFERGINEICNEQFPLFQKATPMEVELEAGESLFIPTHWWHYTHALEPCIVIAEFWDAPLCRWGYPIAWRSILMKPYRKFLYNRILNLKAFNRKQQVSSRN